MIHERSLMTLPEVAEYLRVCESTIYRMLKLRSIPAFKIQRNWRFRKVAIDAWAEKRESIAEF